MHLTIRSDCLFCDDRTIHVVECEGSKPVRATCQDCGRRSDPPPVLGGQGRSRDDVQDTGVALILWAAVAVLVAGVVLARWLV